MTWIDRAGWVAAAFGALLVSGCAVGPGASESTPAATATGMQSASPSTRIDTPLGLPVSGPIDPGPYFIPRGAYSVARFTFTLPSGWVSQNSARIIAKHPDEPGELGFGPFVVTQIYSDSCAGEGVLVDVGPTVDDLVNGLLAQRGPSASGPEEIMLGGYAAKRIDLTVPTDLDLATCRLQDIGLQLWLDASGDKYMVLLGDGTLSVYVADVQGERLIITTQFRANSSADDVAEMEAIIESIRIEP